MCQRRSKWHVNVTLSAAPREQKPVGNLFVIYGRLIGPLLGGYLLFDKAFAYIHLPGTPLFVSEMVLGVGLLASIVATGYFWFPLRDEPILALLGAFALWGLTRSLPGLVE